jgi:hypothetical protein
MPTRTSSTRTRHPRSRDRRDEVSTRPKCTYIPCVLDGYKLIRTLQAVISKLNPTREDTAANHFRPTTARIQRCFSKPHPAFRHNATALLHRLPTSTNIHRHPPPSTATDATVATSTSLFYDHTYSLLKAPFAFQTCSRRSLLSPSFLSPSSTFRAVYHRHYQRRRLQIQVTRDDTIHTRRRGWRGRREWERGVYGWRT